MSRTNSEQLAA